MGPARVEMGPGTVEQKGWGSGLEERKGLVRKRNKEIIRSQWGNRAAGPELSPMEGYGL